MSIITHEAAGEIASGMFQYLLLTATNYTSWVIRVQAMMEDQGIREAVEPTAGVAVDTRKDKKARSHLLQALPKDLLMQVEKKATAKEVWDCLKMKFVGADRVRNARLQTLKSDFDTMRMQEGETLDQYAGRLTWMSVNVIAGIEQFCDLDTMLFEEAAEWEARQKRSGGDPSLTRKERTHGEGAVRSRGGRGRGRGGHGDFPLIDRAGGSGGGGRDKSHIRCFNCNELGHYANWCKAPKRKEAHLTQVDNIEPALLLAELEEVVSAILEPPEWQDRNHMIADKVKFQELDEAITGKEVYYISRLRSNIVSLEQLIEAGHKLIMKVRRTPNRLYRIKMQIARPLCLLANLEDPAWLWRSPWPHELSSNEDACKQEDGNWGTTDHSSRSVMPGVFGGKVDETAIPVGSQLSSEGAT
ncbi:uncharacterized protein LOC116260255 [Nymphaea colorata]|uniref:uncharacterized protein LOC116260255 n=1 Tax=Nymphaea colorata TaxID=210225 RepID=UPI00129E835A|nr:uncharacterized protein LOC116260255 [Nymphaea colorata]